MHIEPPAVAYQRVDDEYVVCDVREPLEDRQRE